jgi:hemerythrin-like domain-containing protein
MMVEEHDRSAALPHPGGIEPSPPQLLKEPLEFLFAEHFRQRQMCKILEYLAVAPAFDVAMIATTDDFIRYDLALHVIDEEEDFFPLLRRRCSEEDDIEDILGRLSADHALDQKLAVRVRAVFAQSLERRTPPSAIEGGAQALLELAKQEKSHMALENAVVMPLARRRLTADDLEALSLRLAARRGVATG